MKVRVPKTALRARPGYDYRRLEREDFFLLPLRIEEEKETVCMNFDIRGMRPFVELKGTGKEKKLSGLLQAGELVRLHQQYDFSLSPENLYYDISGRVRVMMRDIVSDQERGRQQRFLKEYQALAGYILEGSRSFEDYLSGGYEILKGKSEESGLFEPETVREEKAFLSEYLEQVLEEEKRNMCRVGKRRYKGLKIYSVISALLMVLLGAGAVYGLVFYMPRQERFMAANEAYIKKDYTAMIDELQTFSTKELSYIQKVMLAAAYIQGEAVDHFSVKDKENILSRINCQSSDEILDYWIRLGRLEIKEAENLAMKMSDDQLLLYAYMKDLDQTEENGELSGEEKRDRQQRLMKEIRALAQELGISAGDGEEGVYRE